MNYELAKELQDNGFPQRGRGYFHEEEVRINQQSVPTYVQWYIPTLSELIGACDTTFFELSRLEDGWGCNDHYQTGTGNTPEEAVAKLWLALNKQT